jgi:hypothetical protein
MRCVGRGFSLWVCCKNPQNAVFPATFPTALIWHAYLGTQHPAAAVIMGRPNPKHISTSYSERQNLTMRMQVRRFTRLTNAFSKKVDNLRHAVALYAVHYNFCRIHQTLRVTPAMEAGITQHVSSISEIVALSGKSPSQKAA